MKSSAKSLAAALRLLERDVSATGEKSNPLVARFLRTFHLPESTELTRCGVRAFSARTGSAYQKKKVSKSRDWNMFASMRTRIYPSSHAMVLRQTHASQGCLSRGAPSGR